jgi:hypothetical protein
LGSGFYDLGLNHLARGEQAAAIDAFQSAVRHHRLAFDQGPGISKFRVDLRADWLHLALCLRMLGRTGEAAGVMHERASLGSEGPTDLYNDACQLALCIPIAHPAVQAQELAEEAMATLHAAVAAGWNNAAHTSRDPDLAPLHDRDDFRRLLGQLFDRGFPADPFARR